MSVGVMAHRIARLEARQQAMQPPHERVDGNARDRLEERLNGIRARLMAAPDYVEEVLTDDEMRERIAYVRQLLRAGLDEVAAQRKRSMAMIRECRQRQRDARAVAEEARYRRRDPYQGRAE